VLRIADRRFPDIRSAATNPLSGRRLVCVIRIVESGEVRKILDRELPMTPVEEALRSLAIYNGAGPQAESRRSLQYFNSCYAMPLSRTLSDGWRKP